MANKIIQLKDKSNNNLYPTILGGSIPDKGIELSKLSQSVQDKINGSATDANIQQLNENVTTNTSNIEKLTNFAYKNDCAAFDGFIDGTINLEGVGLNGALGENDSILWSNNLKYFVLQKTVSGTAATKKYYNTWNDSSSSANGSRPCELFQDDTTPHSTKLYFDKKNNVVYRYDSSSQSLIALADKGAMDNLTSKVNTLQGLTKEIDVSALDTLKDVSMYKSGSPSTYSVILGSNKANVGFMILFSDSGGHALTQVLYTHYLIKDSSNQTNTIDNIGTVTEGSLDTSSHDHLLHVYSRSYALQAVAGTVNTWSKWKVVGGNDISSQLTVLNSSVNTINDNMLTYTVVG